MDGGYDKPRRQETACRSLRERRHQQGGGQSYSAASKARSQAVAALIEPPTQRAQPQSELGRRLVAGALLQVAQHERRSELLWQSHELFVERCQHLAPARLAVGTGHGRALGARLAGSAARCPRLEFARQAVRHAIQPTAERGVLADRRCGAGQHEKCRLAGVLGVVPVLEHSSADCEHHGRVPLDQGSKRGFIAALHEALQQLVVGQADNHLGGHELARVLQNRLQATVGHGASSPPLGLGLSNRLVPASAKTTNILSGKRWIQAGPGGVSSWRAPTEMLKRELRWCPGRCDRARSSG